MNSSRSSGLTLKWSAQVFATATTASFPAPPADAAGELPGPTSSATAPSSSMPYLLRRSALCIRGDILQQLEQAEPLAGVQLVVLDQRAIGRSQRKPKQPDLHTR